MDLDELEELQEDLAESMAEVAEVDEVLGRDYIASAEVNEEDLMAELANLDQELAGLPDDLPVAAETAAAGGSYAPVAQPAFLQPLPAASSRPAPVPFYVGAAPNAAR